MISHDTTVKVLARLPSSQDWLGMENMPSTRLMSITHMVDEVIQIVRGKTLPSTGILKYAHDMEVKFSLE